MKIKDMKELIIKLDALSDIIKSSNLLIEDLFDFVKKHEKVSKNGQTFISKLNLVKRMNKISPENLKPIKKLGRPKKIKE